MARDENPFGNVTGGISSNNARAVSDGWRPTRNNWTPDHVTSIKELLAKSGYYIGFSEDKLKAALSNTGQWEQFSAQAYATAWQDYYDAGGGKTLMSRQRPGQKMTLGEFLSQRINPANWAAIADAMGGGRGGGGGVGPKLVLSNPDDLKTIFGKVSQQVLGRAVDDDALNHFVDVYHGAEKTAFGGTEQAPSPDVAAEKELRQSNPEEAGAHDIANQFNNFLQIINGGGSTTNG